MSKKDKKKRKGTTLIKWGVLALSLSMPILELGTSALYTLNPNAYQSYSNKKVINETSYVSNNILQPNYDYALNIKTFIQESTTYTRGTPKLFYNGTIDWNKYANYNETQLSQIKGFAIMRANENYVNIFLYNENETNFLTISKNISTWLSYSDLTIYFNLNHYSNETYTTLFGNYLIQFIYKTDSLDNIIPYKKQQQLETGILSWTPTSFTYSAINNMLVGLNVNDQYLSGLLTYWTMITAIYVVFDVVLHFFEWITHMLNKEE